MVNDFQNDNKKENNKIYNTKKSSSKQKGKQELSIYQILINFKIWLNLWMLKMTVTVIFLQ